jgi:hypothetical protein
LLILRIKHELLENVSTKREKISNTQDREAFKGLIEYTRQTRNLLEKSVWQK